MEMKNEIKSFVKDRGYMGKVCGDCILGFLCNPCL